MLIAIVGAIASGCAVNATTDASPSGDSESEPYDAIGASPDAGDAREREILDVGSTEPSDASVFDDDATSDSASDSGSDSEMGDTATFVRTVSPLIRGNCKTWTPVPYRISYLAPVATPDGIYVQASSHDILFRLKNDEWSSLAITAPPATLSSAPFYMGFGALNGELAAIRDLCDGLAGECALDPASRSQLIISTGSSTRTLPIPFFPVYNFISGSDVFISDGMNIYAFDSDHWTSMGGGPTGLFWGTRPDSYAIRSNGMVVAPAVVLDRYDGQKWVPTSIPLPKSFIYQPTSWVYKFAGTGDGELFVADQNNVYPLKNNEVGVPEPAIACAQRPVDGGTQVIGMTGGFGTLVVTLACNIPGLDDRYHYWIRTGRIWREAPSNLALRHIEVSPNGSVFASADNAWNDTGGETQPPIATELLQLKGNAWVPLPTEAGPPGGFKARIAAGNKDEIYITDTVRPAKLSGDKWEDVRGIDAQDANVAAMYAAPTGELFATRTNGEVVVLSGGQWTRLPGVQNAQLVTGRSANEVYVSTFESSPSGATNSVLRWEFGAANSVLRWDGRSWTDLNQPCHPTNVGVQTAIHTIGLVGSASILVGCSPGFGLYAHLPDYQTAALNDGLGWNDVNHLIAAISHIDQVGPPTDAKALTSLYTSAYDNGGIPVTDGLWTIFSQAGHVRFSADYADRMAGPSLNQLVRVRSGAFSRISPSGDAWEPDVTAVSGGGSISLWTDGRFAAAPVLEDGGSWLRSPVGEGIMMCDLGP